MFPREELLQSRQKAAWRYSRTQVKLAATAVKEFSRGKNVLYNIKIV